MFVQAWASQGKVVVEKLRTGSFYPKQVSHLMTACAVFGIRGGRTPLDLAANFDLNPFHYPRSRSTHVDHVVDLERG